MKTPGKRAKTMHACARTCAKINSKIMYSRHSQVAAPIQLFDIGQLTHGGVYCTRLNYFNIIVITVASSYLFIYWTLINRLVDSANSLLPPVVLLIFQLVLRDVSDKQLTSKVESTFPLAPCYSVTRTTCPVPYLFSRSSATTYCVYTVLKTQTSSHK